MRIAVPFLLLPWLPGLALFIPAGSLPLVGDRIVVGVLVGLVVALCSAALARADGAPFGKAVLCAAATAALSLVAFAVIVGITFTVACGSGGGSC
jgi:hypothetical protein